MSEQNNLKITISLKEYSTLIKRNEWLSCLEMAGVDNWSGIGEAQIILTEMLDAEAKKEIHFKADSLSELDAE